MKNPRELIWLSSFWILAIVLHLRMGELPVTGDEPRYIFGGLRPWLNEKPSIEKSLGIWVDNQNFKGLTIPLDKGPHAVVHMWVISPVLRFLGLTSARWCVFILAMMATTYFVFHYRQKFSWSRAITATIFCVTVPTLPYMRLFYAEIWGCAVLLILLPLTTKEKLKSHEWLCATSLIILLPFLHIRFFPAAFVFGIYFLARWWMQESRHTVRAILSQLLLLCTAVIVFRIFQNSMSHGSTSSIPAMQPQFRYVVERSAIHLISYRHGLLLLNPLILTSFAGFFIGLRKRNSEVILSAVAFGSLFLGFIWGSGLESYPARFWVVAIPTLIVGTSYWITQTRIFWSSLIGGVLGLIGLANTFILVRYPTAMLSNRFGMLSYDFVYHWLNEKFHPGLLSIVDPFETGGLLQNFNNHALEAILFILAIAIAIALLSDQRQKTRFVAAFLIGGCSLFVANEKRTSSISLTKGGTVTGIDTDGHSYIEISLADATPIKGFKIGDYSDWELWGIDPSSPKEFQLTGIKEDGSQFIERRIPGFQMIELRENPKLRTLRITSMTFTNDRSWTKLSLVIFKID